jgi:DNA repair exonuclease SbcCD nuclease subunit
MKVAIITDQHFGARNDSLHFIEFYEKFYRDTFFPRLLKEKIDTVLILGDTFDRRKYVNFYSLQRAKQMFFDKLSEHNINVHMLVGNHDTYYKNTNDVNSPDLLLEDYDNIKTISSPTTLNLGGQDILMMPWICAENYDESMRMIKESTAPICMGHFEIQGFQMYRGAPSHDGLDMSVFSKFDVVFSGHYHHKSKKGNIHYLGNPYELTWQDYDDDRGFHIFDTKSQKLTFVKNPNNIFKRISYDDKGVDTKTITEMDLTTYKGAYVKVLVVNKTNPYLFDLFVNNLHQIGPVDVTIAEDILELEDDDIDVDQTEDTTTILNKYVDNLATDLDKDKLKTLLREMYVDALNGEV